MDQLSTPTLRASEGKTLQSTPWSRLIARAWCARQTLEFVSVNCGPHVQSTTVCYCSYVCLVRAYNLVFAIRKQAN